MKGKYKVELTNGTHTYCQNGTELDQLVNELLARGVKVQNIQIFVQQPL